MYISDEYIEFMRVTSLLLGIVGLLGNFVSCVVFSRPAMFRTTIGVLLLALSVADLLMLVISAMQHLFTSEEHWLELVHFPLLFGKSFGGVMVTISHGAFALLSTCSVNIIVLIAVERWIATCTSLQEQTWRSPTNAKRAVVCSTVFSIFYNSAQLVLYVIDDSEGVFFLPLYANGSDDERSWWQYFDYHVLFYFVFTFMIPLLVIVLADGHVIVVSCLHPRVLNDQKERTTTMLLWITIPFAVCHAASWLPHFHPVFIRHVVNNDLLEPYVYSINLLEMLMMIKYSTTFAVYFFLSERYRRTLKAIVCCSGDARSENPLIDFSSLEILTDAPQDCTSIPMQNAEPSVHRYPYP